ncbi:hypothetical protein B0H16DRAFT_1883491 [Mycena metata]|uniref:Uncharacterized protein n=1 Tax=Mycena metata TaxID=1033252 RepID=A0AAD7NJZ5_9AGAR|nr:hypothetical protein B0H16DRAFT_1883491 [Mycena metata]
MDQNSSAPARPPRVSANPTATADGDVGVRATRERPASIRWSRARRASSFVPPPASAPHEDGEVDEFGLRGILTPTGWMKRRRSNSRVNACTTPGDAHAPAYSSPPASSTSYAAPGADASRRLSYKLRHLSRLQLPLPHLHIKFPRTQTKHLKRTAHPRQVRERERPPQHHARGTFPPPGTLVVVQGVVDTTDVPVPEFYVDATGRMGGCRFGGLGLGRRPYGNRKRKRGSYLCRSQRRRDGGRGCRE